MQVTSANALLVCTVAPHRRAQPLFFLTFLLAQACGGGGGGGATTSDEADAQMNVEAADGGDAGADAGSVDDAGAGEAGLDEPDADDASDGEMTPDGDSGESETDAGGMEDGGEPGDASDDAVTFTISPEEDRRAISPYVYGVDSIAAADDFRAGLIYFGNDEVSGYNWEINATNVRGEDDAQLNVPWGTGAEAALPAALLDAADGKGMALLALPIGDYVAGDAEGDDVLLQPDYLAQRFKNNRAVKGAAFELVPDLTDDVVYQDEFVNWVKARAGETPVTFALDNEPGIWESIHPAFHPVKATYADVVDLGVEYAKAIKAVWPEAQVSGPVGYGWLEFESLQGSPDAEAYGPFLPHYLSEMAAAEEAEGYRLLDYLDVHWYPELYTESNRVIDDHSDPGLSALRVQAPRSLWDAEYREPSWVQDSVAEPLQLLPRLQSIIDDHYPGTQLAVSAWTYGGGSDISGAVASADALGAFGREGVALAAAELGDDPGAYTMAAFHAFLDYDGSGARFGDTSVRAVTSDREASSVYASVRSDAEDEIVIVAINRQTEPLDTSLVLDSTTAYATCDVYTLTSEGPSLVPAEALTVSDSNRFAYTMPARSVAVIVPSP